MRSVWWRAPGQQQRRLNERWNWPCSSHQRSVSHTGADGKQLADINFRVYVQLAMVPPINATLSHMTMLTCWHTGGYPPRLHPQILSFWSANMFSWLCGSACGRTFCFQFPTPPRPPSLRVDEDWRQHWLVINFLSTHSECLCCAACYYTIILIKSHHVSTLIVHQVNSKLLRCHWRHVRTWCPRQQKLAAGDKQGRDIRHHSCLYFKHTFVDSLFGFRLPLSCWTSLSFLLIASFLPLISIKVMMSSFRIECLLIKV